jgi:hypothetical protein
VIRWSEAARLVCVEVERMWDHAETVSAVRAAVDGLWRAILSPLGRNELGRLIRMHSWAEDLVGRATGRDESAEDSEDQASCDKRGMAVLAEPAAVPG